MQYCSFQHRTLLLSPVPPTTGCCFRFGSIPSFFLELFLHRSPVAYWAPNDLGSSAEYIMRNAGLEEAQAGIKISGRNINHLRSADDICRSYNSSAQKSPFALSKSLRMKATVFTIIHKALHNLFPIISLRTRCMTSLLFFHFF